MKAFLHSKAGGHRGMTLVEVMVAVGLSSLVLAVLMALFVSSLANFTGLGNYAELTGQSRLSLDRMSREIRESTQVLACNTNLPVKSLTLTNAHIGKTITYTWDSASETITMQRSGEPAEVYLTGCEAWNFSFYQRTPNKFWTFFQTSDPRTAKLINMSWKCSREVLGKRINTETVVTSQVVLRNKP
ncbi:MAG TPA: prepilin-type N-terminal cleavage/methylation domain-containing protein [Clostridia bacterium]|nr:prepilin-type N-terminal cleavage/methylation domain-containing protein [Clostridia bacterium]